MIEVKRHANLITLYVYLHENFRCLTKLFTKRGFPNPVKHKQKSI